MLGSDTVVGELGGFSVGLPRLLGTRRAGQTLYLAVEWLRTERDRPERYSVVEIALDRIAVCWCYHRTAAATHKALLAQISTQVAPELAR